VDRDTKIVFVSVGALVVLLIGALVWTLEQGYGLAGGGVGAYTFCHREGCDYFDKVQDADE